jgi:hypothetical protein
MVLLLILCTTSSYGKDITQLSRNIFYWRHNFSITYAPFLNYNRNIFLYSINVLRNPKSRYKAITFHLDKACNYNECVIAKGMK